MLTSDDDSPPSIVRTSSRRGRSTPRRLMLLGLALASATTSLDAQYFGRNKVQYEPFDFRVLPTEHFRLYFYPAESLMTTDAARMAERWYHRHNRLLRQPFTENPLIFYADQPDFQQTNVIEDMLSQGTGGVTESSRDRVIMPFTGVHAETDHVLGHELVHVFQYRMAASGSGSPAALAELPLWFIEGMAEYLSVGRQDPHTAMWLRDAIRRNDLPGIDALETDPRYFPYRFGQALWAYIAGVHGDEVVARLYRASLRGGVRFALDSVLRTSPGALTRAWHEALRAELASGSRVAPDSLGRGIALTRHQSDQNVSPSISPDGARIAFFSSRSLFGFDVYIADVASGRVTKKVTSVVGRQHFDALSFISTAGTWSPDSRSLAFVVYADGNNRIDIVDVASGRTTQRIGVRGVGAINDPAWSPDGRQILFSGLSGGISDLYLHDLSARTTTRLTEGRSAEIHPAWSPDGRTIAFATDRGDETDFQSLRYGSMRLALLDVATRNVTLIPRIGNGKHITPQFAPDGQTLYFVSDQDGVSDVYRRHLASGAVSRVTRVATGVSGITALAPALSVAAASGRLALSVFHNAGYQLRILEPTEAAGVPVADDQLSRADTQVGTLPPQAALSASVVSRSLRDAADGLPIDRTATPQPFRSRLFANYIRASGIGVTFGGGYGSGIGGGVAIGFTDMVGNRIAQAVVQAQGELADIGAQVFYLDRRRRWNWGAQAYHVPFVGVSARYEDAQFDTGNGTAPGTVFTAIRQRVFFDDAEMLAQYPLSATHRFEFSAGGQRISFSGEVDSTYVINNEVVRRTRSRFPVSPALNLATGSVAFVGDRSFFGFTSPVAGARYRVDASPSIGSLTYNTVMLDYRHYLFVEPVTFAARGLHVGRYGRDSESNRLQPMFIGQPILMRGYEADDFSASECIATRGALDSCPQFSRLAGSRVAILNAELRIPLVGNERFGLIPLRFLPIEVAPFVDAGVAWSADDSPTLRFARNTPERVPVFSAGVTSRLNLFNAAILEVFWVHPFQRPGRGSYVGFQLAPGW